MATSDNDDSSAPGGKRPGTPRPAGRVRRPAPTGKRRPPVAGTRGRPADPPRPPRPAEPEQKSPEQPEQKPPGQPAPKPAAPLQQAPQQQVPAQAPASASSPSRPMPTIEAERPARPGGRPPWFAAAIVGVVAVALAAFAVIAAFRPGAAVDNRAWVDAGATSEVTAAAANALQTLYGYDHTTIDEDFDAARAVLSDEMRAEFDETADTTKDAARQTLTATDASVTDIGLSRLESDLAEFTAYVTVSVTRDGIAVQSSGGPVTGTMANTGDGWVLSHIADAQ